MTALDNLLSKNSKTTPNYHQDAVKLANICKVLIEALEDLNTFFHTVTPENRHVGIKYVAQREYIKEILSRAEKIAGGE